MKLEELHLGDGFIEIPGASINCVLDSISSRTLSHLTIELPGRSQATETTWDALTRGWFNCGEGKKWVADWRWSSPLHYPRRRFTTAYRVLDIGVCCSWDVKAARAAGSFVGPRNPSAILPRQGPYLSLPQTSALNSLDPFIL